jgi:hypothetical protein
VIFIHLVVVVVVRGIVASKKKRFVWDNTHHFNAEIDASDKERYGRGDKTSLSMIQEWCLPVQDVNFLPLPLRTCGKLRPMQQQSHFASLPGVENDLLACRIPREQY